MIFPADDPWRAWEWPGGCEDPRVVESPDGGYACVYTAFDGKSAALFVATSPDLRHWDKHGPAFAGTPYAKRWSKSGSIVTELVDERLVAARHDGRYWMYWGEGVCFAATSTDLVRWEPVEYDAPDRYLTYAADHNSWDLTRVPGPKAARPLLFTASRPIRLAARRTRSARPQNRGRDRAPLQRRQPPRARRPRPPLLRLPTRPSLFRSDRSAHVHRSLGRAVPRRRAGRRTPGAGRQRLFVQGLVRFDRRFFLYYGMADSRIGCAVSPAT